jgi:hypothetical protein
LDIGGETHQSFGAEEVNEADGRNSSDAEADSETESIDSEAGGESAN